jgi:Ca2+/H+ antiporter
VVQPHLEVRSAQVVQPALLLAPVLLACGVFAWSSMIVMSSVFWELVHRTLLSVNLPRGGR